METFSSIDQKWVRVHDADARAAATTGLLEQVEAREVTILKRTLDAQEGTVARLGSEVASVTEGTQGLAADITRASLQDLQGRLYETILEADMGIVDVYWMRKTEVVERRQQLKSERSDRISEMEARFALIRQKLEE
jgi:hypothetical protein